MLHLLLTPSDGGTAWRHLLADGEARAGFECVGPIGLARRLALRARARPLPITHPRIRREPPPALPSRTRLGRHDGHRPPPAGLYLSSASLHLALHAIHPPSGWVISREQGWVDSGER